MEGRDIDTGIRVLHVINQLDGRGGAEVSLRDNILGSLDQGITHGVAVLRRSNVLEQLQDAGVPTFVPVQDLGRPAGRRHVSDVIADFRPDLLHTSLFDADLAGRTAAWSTGTPVLTSLVNAAYGREARAAEPVATWKLEAVRRADAALARHATTAFHSISHAAADHAIRRLGIDGARIRVVPRGRDAQCLGGRSSQRRAQVRQREGWGERPVAVNVARQEPQKGQGRLVEAWPAVLERHPQALLVMVGRDGRSSAGLRATVDRLGLAEQVRFAGQRDDVPDLVAAADVFVFPSLYEGLGGAVVEAAGIGTPVVASDLPALREVLGADHPWLLPPSDPAALARAVDEVLTDPSRAEQHGRRARERFTERFELAGVAQRMVQLYRDLDRAVRDRGRVGPLHRVPRLRSWP